MTRLILAALVLASAAGAQQSQTFTGVITDSECATAKHSAMGMGANDAECAAACVYSHGASYVLFDGKTAFGLSDQKASAPLAGRTRHPRSRHCDDQRISTVACRTGSRDSMNFRSAQMKRATPSISATS